MLRSRTVPPLEARLQENSLKHMTTRTRLRPPEERVSPLQLAVTTALDDMKAVNVRVLDVRELTDVFDHHGVEDIGQLPHVQHPDIHGLHVIERGRHGKLKRRDALRGRAQDVW